MGRRRLLLLFMLVLAAASCSRPDSVEQFQRSSRMVDGHYLFDLDLSDESCTYDISFYTAYDRRILKTSIDSAFVVAVGWTSDEGDMFDEAVWMVPDEGPVVLPYRTGVEMNHKCGWTLCVTPVDPPRRMRGLGIICRRNDGTR